MNDMPTVATEVARNVPLPVGAIYLSFMSTYGSAIVTTLAIIFAGMQFYLRWKEHKHITRIKEKADGDGE